jgi:hypothetical protein
MALRSRNWIFPARIRIIVFYCPASDFLFVVLLDERHSFISEALSIPQSTIKTRSSNRILFMNYPYSSYLMDAQRAKQRIAQLFQAESVHAPGANRALARRSYWMRGDMDPLGFAWVLLVLATFGATQSDQPAFWLSVGPAPLVIGFAVAALLRRKSNLCSYRRGLRPPRGLASCQWQCQ